MADIQRDNTKAKMQSRSADQQVLECNAHTTGGLLSFNPTGKLCDVHCNWMNHHIAAELRCKRTSTLTLRVLSGAVDSVGEFYNRYHGKSGLDFSVCSLNTTEDLTQAFSAPLACNEYAGVEDQSHGEILRALRLLIISSRSPAQSAPTIASKPTPFPSP